MFFYQSGRVLPQVDTIQNMEQTASDVRDFIFTSYIKDLKMMIAASCEIAFLLRVKKIIGT